MNKLIRLSILAAAVFATAAVSSAQPSYASLSDPEGVTTVYIGANEGVAWYSIDHGNTLSMPASRLGLKTNAFDWSELKLQSFENDEIIVDYTMDRQARSITAHRPEPRHS